jgi:hypothetical protein
LKFGKQKYGAVEKYDTKKYATNSSSIEQELMEQ